MLRAQSGPQILVGPAGNNTGLTGLDGKVTLFSQYYKKVWNSYIPGQAYGTPNNSASVIGQTYSTLFALECDFDAVRVPVYNYDTANPQTYSAVAVSVTGNAADGVNGSGAWSVATFGGQTSVTVPVATSVSGRVQPGVALSDPVYIASVPRTDGGTKPLVCVRMYMGGTPGATTYSTLWFYGTGGSTGGWSSNADGRIILAYRATGDFASSNWSGMTTGGAAPERGYTCCMGVVYRARAPRNASILCIGDSITRGANADANGLSWTYKLMKLLSQAGYPVTTVNAGISGSKSAEFLSVAKTIMPLFPATHAIYPVWTPNDSTGPAITTADIAVQRSNLIQFLDLCSTYGVIPILWKGTPRSTDATTTPPVPWYSNDGLRTSWVNSVAATYGAIVIDTLASLSAANGAYLFGLTVEGLHPNAQGDTLLANAISSGIAPYI